MRRLHSLPLLRYPGKHIPPLALPKRLLARFQEEADGFRAGGGDGSACGLGVASTAEALGYRGYIRAGIAS